MGTAGTMKPTQKYLANPIPLFHTPDKEGRTELRKCWVKNKDTEKSFDYLKKDPYNMIMTLHKLIDILKVI